MPNPFFISAPAMRLRLYGIPNCDTVKKARRWLDEQGLDHEFHDFKKQGVPEAALTDWIAACGWETLVNRRGTTWRLLNAAQQAAVNDAASARALMLAQPSVIKRPVATLDGRVVAVGFDEAAYANLKAAAQG